MAFLSREICRELMRRGVSQDLHVGDHVYHPNEHRLMRVVKATGAPGRALPRVIKAYTEEEIPTV